MGERKVIVSKRFVKNTRLVYEYIQKEFSTATAESFLRRLFRRIDFIAKNPEAGKPSLKRPNVRSILFSPNNQIFYRYHKEIIELLMLFDMRKDPNKNPY